MVKVPLSNEIWGQEQQAGWNSAKHALASTVKLSHPDPFKRLIVCTDASELHWGAVITITHHYYFSAEHLVGQPSGGQLWRKWPLQLSKRVAVPTIYYITHADLTCTPIIELKFYF